MDKKKQQEIDNFIKTLDKSYFESVTPRQAQFVREYLKDGNGARAARLAGYAEKQARMAASRLIKDPAIIAIINKLKTFIAEQMVYDHSKAVEEADELIQLAKAKSQYTAVARLYELKLKLHKLIEDKFTVDMNLKTGFSVQVTGLIAPPYARPAIDVTPDTKQIEESKTTSIKQEIKTEVVLPNGSSKKT